MKAGDAETYGIGPTLRHYLLCFLVPPIPQSWPTGVELALITFMVMLVLLAVYLLSCLLLSWVCARRLANSGQNKRQLNKQGLPMSAKQCLRCSILHPRKSNLDEVHARMNVLDILDGTCEKVDQVPTDLGIVDSTEPHQWLFFKTSYLSGSIEILFAGDVWGQSPAGTTT